MIDEKKLIQEIEKEIDGVIVKDTYSRGKNAGLRKARILAEEQFKIGDWIPCSERMPTKEESIKNDNRFILDDGNRRYGGLFDYEKQCFVQFDFWKGLVEDKCVIAWQPLPEAYHG